MNVGAITAVCAMVVARALLAAPIMEAHAIGRYNWYSYSGTLHKYPTRQDPYSAESDVRQSCRCGAVLGRLSLRWWSTWRRLSCHGCRQSHPLGLAERDRLPLERPQRTVATCAWTTTPRWDEDRFARDDHIAAG